VFTDEDHRFIIDLSGTGQHAKKGCAEMRRSKLETYEAILEALMKKPLDVDRIAYETGLDCAVLNQRLSFLLENGLVEERFLTKKTLYAITERGVAVFKTLNFNKYLEKVSHALSAIDDAMHTLPLISKDQDERPEEWDER
jgi:predicted transcriptional regulator